LDMPCVGMVHGSGDWGLDREAISTEELFLCGNGFPAESRVPSPKLNQRRCGFTSNANTSGRL